jgi:hypothetical protein
MPVPASETSLQCFIGLRPCPLCSGICLRNMGSGTHSDSKFGRRGGAVSYIETRTKVLERRSSALRHRKYPRLYVYKSVPPNFTHFMYIVYLFLCVVYNSFYFSFWNDKLVCTVGCLLSCCVMQLGRNWPTFRRCLLCPSSRHLWQYCLSRRKIFLILCQVNCE